MLVRELQAHRPLLMIGLTLVAGGVDALGYFRLGHVFVANMTGNVVLMAIAVAGGNASQAIRSLWALLGFMVGAFGASAMPSGRRVWVMVAAECVLLIVMALLFWHAKIVHSRVDLGAIAVGSLAMGVQSRLARHVNLAGTATTVVTSTLTQIMDDAVQFMSGRRPVGWSSRLAVFMAYALGAGLAALGRRHPVLVLAALLLIVILLGLSVVRVWPVDDFPKHR